MSFFDDYDGDEAGFGKKKKKKKQTIEELLSQGAAKAAAALGPAGAGGSGVYDIGGSSPEDVEPDTAPVAAPTPAAPPKSKPSLIPHPPNTLAALTSWAIMGLVALSLYKLFFRRKRGKR